MAKKDPYREFLKKDFGEIFDTLKLPDLQRKFLNSRWLDQAHIPHPGVSHSIIT